MTCLSQFTLWIISQKWILSICFFTVMVYDMKMLMLMFALKSVSTLYLSTYKTVSVRFLEPADQPSVENKSAGDPNTVVHYNILFLWEACQEINLRTDAWPGIFGAGKFSSN